VLHIPDLLTAEFWSDSLCNSGFKNVSIEVVEPAELMNRPIRGEPDDFSGAGDSLLSSRVRLPPIALITGSTGGIGQAIVRELASQGFEVWLGCQSQPDRGEKLRDELRQQGAAELVVFDVAQRESCEAALAPLLEQRGSVSAFVHCAGVTKQSLLLATAPSDWNRVVSVNLTGFYNVCRILLRGMMQQRSGSIVGISSVVARSGLAGQAAYAASKAALEGAVRSLAREVGAYNVRANAISPGWIDAGMNEGKSAAPVLDRIPLRRMGRPADVAGAVGFLCSTGASYVSGSVIPVSGGLDL
jgi:3-oxoacyl-[acyl-carrier protein] reductase